MPKTGFREGTIDFLSFTVGNSERGKELAPLTLGLIRLLSAGHIDMNHAREQKWALKGSLETYARVYGFELAGVGLSQKDGIARFEVSIIGDKDRLLNGLGNLPSSFAGIQIAYEFMKGPAEMLGR